MMNFMLKRLWSPYAEGYWDEMYYGGRLYYKEWISFEQRNKRYRLVLFVIGLILLVVYMLIK